MGLWVGLVPLCLLAHGARALVQTYPALASGQQSFINPLAHRGQSARAEVNSDGLDHGAARDLAIGVLAASPKVNGGLPTEGV